MGGQNGVGDAVFGNAAMGQAIDDAAHAVMRVVGDGDGKVFMEDTVVSTTTNDGNTRRRRVEFLMSKKQSSYLPTEADRANPPARRIICTKFTAAAWATVHGAEESSPAIVRQHMSRIKHPLRPRPVQMLYSHPSYLDCIVWPRFRERVVQASVDGVLDHVEFWMDLMGGGVVCWGGSTPGGNGGRARRRGRRGGMGEGVPWHARSWEARRWFLEKWGWLVGSEEEEEREGERDGIWGCSRFWWGMRGEVESEDEDEDEDGEEEEDESEEAVLRRLYESVDGRMDGASRFDLRGANYLE